LESNAAELLLEYAAGGLNGSARAALESHMTSCARCASFRAEQMAVWKALDVWEAPPVSMDFNRNLWRRIDAAGARPWYRSLAEAVGFAPFSSHILKPVLPLTAALALITAGFIWDHPGAKKADAGFTVQEATQVEQMLDDIQLLHQFDVTSDGARTMSR
jgi:anti-sigma factor RsiW